MVVRPTLELYEQAPVTGRQLQLDDEDGYYEEVLGSGQSDEEEGETDHPEFTALRHSKGSDPLVTATRQDIASLIEWGRRYEHRPDSRLAALITFLDAICRPDGRTWTNERVVVFTEYATTLDWIARVLAQRGYRDVLETIQGCTPTEDREKIRARFTEDPAKHKVRVLIATDSAGEGIDLQAHCHRLVNFDIPFNPSRLEQRIGRIDRYGQRETPEIYHFAPDSTSTTYTADMDFMRRIAEKVGNVAQDLGSVNQVIDADVQNHFSPTASSRKAKPSAPDDGNAIITRALAGGIELNRRLTELSRTYGERKAEMHLTPGNARRVVDAALALTAQPPLVEVGDADTDAQVFAVPALGSAWQPALRGLDTRLEPGVPRPITFDGEAARGRSDLVHVHLGHALMQRCARVLRGALFSVDAPVNRVTAVVVEDLPQSCVAAVSRLVLVGRGGLRLHEEVFLTGIRVRGQAMTEAKVEQVLDTALDAQDLGPGRRPGACDAGRAVERRWLPAADRDGTQSAGTPGEGRRSAPGPPGHRHRQSPRAVSPLKLRIDRRYHRRMRSDPPPLLPILRSRTQAGALTVLLLNPDLELTQTELARRVGASLSSVVDEVRRLEQAGLLSTRRLGRARLVRAGSGPLVEALAEVMLRAFGPLQIIAEEFGAAAAELDSAVTELALFGSWAARYRGEPGTEPADLDVLVVVTGAGLDRGPLYAAADRAQERLGRPVNPTVVTTDRWACRGTGGDRFVDEIASRPIVPVPLVNRIGN